MDKRNIEEEGIIMQKQKTLAPTIMTEHHTYSHKPFPAYISLSLSLSFGKVTCTWTEREGC